MTRQCLYCAKELPKASASNFCSKECWTEYKKLKALNVGADKQATVMLKKSDLSSGVDPSENEHEEAPQSASPPPTNIAPQSTPQNVAVPPAVVEELTKRIDKIEELITALTKEVIFLSEKTGINPHDTSIGNNAIPDLITRVIKIETTLEKVDDFIRAADKMDERIINVEKKIRAMPTEVKPDKKGFFAKLFG